MHGQGSGLQGGCPARRATQTGPRGDPARPEPGILQTPTASASANPAWKEGVTQLLGSGAEGGRPAQHPHTHSEQGQPRPATEASWAQAPAPVIQETPSRPPRRGLSRSPGVGGTGCKGQTPTPWSLPTHRLGHLRERRSVNGAPIIVTRHKRQPGPPQKSSTLDEQPSPAQPEKMELMGWVPINQLLIAALSPGPALGQVRASPPQPRRHRNPTRVPGCSTPTRQRFPEPERLPPGHLPDPEAPPAGRPCPTPSTSPGRLPPGPPSLRYWPPGRSFRARAPSCPLALGEVSGASCPRVTERQPGHHVGPTS